MGLYNQMVNQKRYYRPIQTNILYAELTDFRDIMQYTIFTHAPFSLILYIYIRHNTSSIIMFLETHFFVLLLKSLNIFLAKQHSLLSQKKIRSKSIRLFFFNSPDTRIFLNFLVTLLTGCFM